MESDQAIEALQDRVLADLDAAMVGLAELRRQAQTARAAHGREAFERHREQTARSALALEVSKLEQERARLDRIVKAQLAWCHAHGILISGPATA